MVVSLRYTVCWCYFQFRKNCPYLKLETSVKKDKKKNTANSLFANVRMGRTRVKILVDKICYNIIISVL